MEAQISEEKVIFFRDALYSHARQVRSYFDSARQRIASYDGGLRQKHRDEFLMRARMLLRQMEQLLSCASRMRSLSCRLNFEQLEAVLAKLKTEVESLAA